MRLATFNMENLFTRPRAMSDDPGVDQKEVLQAFQTLCELISRDTYTPPVKSKILKLIAKFGIRAPRPPVIRLHQVRGKLMTQPAHGPARIDVSGRDDWVGWFELVRTDVTWEATRNTARVVKEVSPDVLVCVEVEDRPTMQRFHDQVLLGHEHAFTYNVLVDGNDSRGIDVGLFSNYPISAVRTHVDERDEDGSALFSRDCPRFDVRLPSGRLLIVLGNHFKSRGYGAFAETSAKRLRQARRVQQIAMEALRDSPYVAVAGDLNDEPDSEPIRTIKHQTGLKDISEHPRYSGRIPTYKASTSLRNKIDYLLLSPALYDTVQAGAVNVNGTFAPRAGSPYPDLRRVQDQASDHGALWADLDI